jgi:hypothetical protein
MNPLQRDKCYVRRLGRNPSGRQFTFALLGSIHRVTPGGITREQILRERHPLRTAITALPYLGLMVGLVALYAWRAH